MWPNTQLKKTQVTDHRPQTDGTGSLLKLNSLKAVKLKNKILSRLQCWESRRKERDSGLDPFLYPLSELLLLLLLYK